jgi:hypothetical protein
MGADRDGPCLSLCPGKVRGTWRQASTGMGRAIRTRLGSAGRDATSLSPRRSGSRAIPCADRLEDRALPLGDRLTHREVPGAVALARQNHCRSPFLSHHRDDTLAQLPGNERISLAVVDVYGPLVPVQRGEEVGLLRLSPELRPENCWASSM